MHKLYKGFHFVAFLATIVLILGGCQNQPNIQQELEYYTVILQNREQNLREITDSATSRFNESEREMFHKKPPKYFAPDKIYKVEASFDLDTSYPVFQMPTTTDRKPNYRIYGFLSFSIKDTLCKLTVYQNYDYKDHPDHGNYVFIPFKDNTSEFSTYGGGRYIDIPIPTSTQVPLDFNTAYNPLCGYSDRWSCPLVPMNNALEVTIVAGEKKYK